MPPLSAYMGNTPGGGRIVLTGPDQDFHAWKFGGVTDLNQYNLLVNEILWAAGQQ